MINFDSLFLQQSDKNNTNLQRKNIKSRNKHRGKRFYSLFKPSQDLQVHCVYPPVLPKIQSKNNDD